MLTLQAKYQATVAKRQLFMLGRLQVLIRFVLLPAVGIGIPLATGFIQMRNAGLVSYLFCVGVALLIYEGNLYFKSIIRNRHKVENVVPLPAVVRYFATNLAFSGFLCLLLLSSWNVWVFNLVPITQPVLHTTLLVILAAGLINLVYEFVYTRQGLHQSLLMLDAARQDMARAETISLRSRLEPHFIYNVLNGLSYLIKHYPSVAEAYNDMLGKAYRYVAEKAQQPVVSLQEELEFCKTYLQMQQLRFPGAIVVKFEGEKQVSKFSMLPPMVLQLLVENACKHNVFSQADPLQITISLKGGAVSVINSGGKRNPYQAGTGLGLQYIHQRYEQLTNFAIGMQSSASRFEVSLPLLAA
jgi:sensor histidine kinase YesM